MAFTPYSVSPRRVDHKRGPNPTKNSVTLILNAFATAKCAASWTRMTRNSARKNEITPIAPITRRGVGGSTGFDDLGRAMPGPRVGALEVDDREHRRGRLVLVDDGLNDLD